MSWEYQLLKRRLGLPSDRLLSLFERFCERACVAMDSMEWSWKVLPDRMLDNRIFWLGAGGCREATSRHLRRLADELGFAPADLPGGIERWRELLDTRTDRALVSYAGPDPAAGRPGVIKTYLTLDRCDEAMWAGSLRGLHAALPAAAPPGAARVLLSYSCGESGESFSRVYVMYLQRELAKREVADYLTPWIGERGLRVARGHPAAGVSVKNDTTDMLGLAFRPTGLALDDHPSWWESPALAPLLHAAGPIPALRERLQRVSWVTVPLSPASLELPYTLPEMNVYVRLV